MSAQRLLYMFLLLGLLTAAGMAPVRAAALRPGRTVELALSLRAVRESSASQAYPFAVMLEHYKEAGVTTLLVGGTTLQGLLDFGGTGYPEQQLLAVDDERVIVKENPALADWIESRLATRLGAGRVSRLSTSEIQVQGLTAPELKRLNLGVHPADLALADEMGWRVAVSFSESEAGLNQVALLDGLPTGAPVLWSGSVGPSAAVLERMQEGGHPLLIDHSPPPFFEGMPPAMTDAFARLGGRALKLFRVTYSHSVNDIVTAVKERQMQVVLVQPYHLSGDLAHDLDAQMTHWKMAGAQLRRSGYTFGKADPPSPFATPIWLFPLFGASIAAALGLLLRAPVWVVVLGAAAALIPGDLTRQGLALAGACLLPALGAVEALAAPTLGARLGWLAGLPFGSGLLIAAILGDSRFAFELALFRGIKVALLAPSVLFVAVMAWREREALAAWWRRRALKVWHVALGLLVLGAVSLMLMRSGQSGDLLLVSSLELKVRALLEQLLLVRPRFKEFLIGWPLLVVAHGLLKRGHRVAGAALMTIGLTAPASLINSFAHLHTPIWLSALRSFHGLWIGALLGGVLLAVLGRGERHA